MDTGSARGAERPLKGFVLCMHVEREGGLPYSLDSRLFTSLSSGRARLARAPVSGRAQSPSWL